MKQTNWLKTGKEIGLTAVCILLAAGLLSCLLGVMILKEWIPLESGPTSAVIVFQLPMLFGCWIRAKSVKQGKLVVSLLTALAVLVLCILSKAIAFPEKELRPEWMSLLPFATAAAAGIGGSRKKQRRR